MSKLLILVERLVIEINECGSPVGIVRGLEGKGELMAEAAKSLLDCEKMLQDIYPWLQEDCPAELCDRIRTFLL